MAYTVPNGFGLTLMFILAVAVPIAVDAVTVDGVKNCGEWWLAKWLRWAAAAAWCG